MKVSCCIISKNEEKNIEKCLKSVLPVVDEVIVLDTGSSDRTIEIAEKYAKVYQTEWENDFSKARNKCINYANNDWILSIDCDEFLDKNVYNNLRNLFSKEHKKNKVFNFNIREITKDRKIIKSFFRNTLFSKEMSFIRPIHEHLYSKELQLEEINRPDLIINSITNIDNKEQIYKKEKNYIARITDAIENNTDKIDNYYYYKHLAISYNNIQDYENSLEAYLKSYSLYNEGNMKKELFYQDLLIEIGKKYLYFKNDTKNAALFINQLLSINSSSIDGLFLLGSIYAKTNKLEQALKTYNRSMELFCIQDPRLENKLFYCNLCLELMRLYRDTNNIQKWHECLQNIYSYFSSNAFIYYHLILFFIFHKDLHRAIIYYFEINREINLKDKYFLESANLLDNTNSRYIQALNYILVDISKVNIWSDSDQAFINTLLSNLLVH